MTSPDPSLSERTDRIQREQPGLNRAAAGVLAIREMQAEATRVHRAHIDRIEATEEQP